MKEKKLKQKIYKRKSKVKVQLKNKSNFKANKIVNHQILLINKVVKITALLSKNRKTKDPIKKNLKVLKFLKNIKRFYKDCTTTIQKYQI